MLIARSAKGQRGQTNLGPARKGQYARAHGGWKQREHRGAIRRAVMMIVFAVMIGSPRGVVADQRLQTWRCFLIHICRMHLHMNLVARLWSRRKLLCVRVLKLALPPPLPPPRSARQQEADKRCRKSAASDGQPEPKPIIGHGDGDVVTIRVDGVGFCARCARSRGRGRGQWWQRQGRRRWW